MKKSFSLLILSVCFVLNNFAQEPIMEKSKFDRVYYSEDTQSVTEYSKEDYTKPKKVELVEQYSASPEVKSGDNNKTSGSMYIYNSKTAAGKNDYRTYRRKTKQQNKYSGEPFFSVEPLKNGIWNANIIKPESFILRPSLAYTWADGSYNTSGGYSSFSNQSSRLFTAKANMHYGINERMDFHTMLGLGTKYIKNNSGSNSYTGFLDIPLMFRYLLFEGTAKSVLTGGLSLVLPTGRDEIDGGDFKFSPILHFTHPFYNTTSLPIAVYANLEYKFRGSKGSTDYGNELHYAFGGEYFLKEHALSFLLSFIGRISADREINGVTTTDNGPSGFDMSPAITYKPENTNFTMMFQLTTRLSGTSINRDNTLALDIQWIFDDFRELLPKR